MEHTDEMICSFCKKSASLLATHSLCGCCLMHSSCCDATAKKSIPVISRPTIEMASTSWEEDAVRKVECDICLEEYHENELQQHRETCMPRLVFRCSLCNEDYLNEESLWNHLTVHQIAYEDKELYYHQKTVTYKQHECILCNDQRSYQESSYWEHVHEDHDGFYLQCSECGESFRSQKRKADHGLNYCKSRDQIIPFESDGLEMDVVYQNTNIDRHSSQEQPNEVLSDEDFEENQQFSLKSEVFESGPTVVEDCDDGLTDDDVGKSESEKEPKVQATEEVLQRHVGDVLTEPSDLKCPQCNKECSSAKTLARHIECSHQPASCDICGLLFSSGGRAAYHKLRNHSKRKFQCPKCSMTFFSKYNYRRHLSVHDDRKYSCKTCNFKFRSKHSLENHMSGSHRKNVQTRQLRSSVNDPEQWKIKTDCPICRENFSNQDQVAQHVEKIHRLTMCTICRETFANVDELNNHKCSMCPHCDQECDDQPRLITHIDLCHEEATCDVCELTFYGKRKLLYHERKVHAEPKFKCSQCSKKFNLKFEYTRHMSFCVKNESKFPCKLCGRQFDSFDSVTAHVTIVHDTSPRCGGKSSDLDMGQEDNRTDQSDDTYKEVAKKFNVKGVHRRRDKSANVCPCKFCGRKFKCKDYVRKHIYRMHSRKSKSQKQPKMEISVEETQLQQNKSQVLSADGGKSTGNSSAYKRCPICGKHCKKSYIARHISDTHDNVSICDICGVSFVKKHQLVYHVLVCHTEPKHKCPYCPEMFHVRYSYTRHVATHEKHNS